MHLLNNLSSRRGGKGCTSMLGWVAEKNPMPDVWHLLLPRGDFDKEKWALHLVLPSSLVAEATWQIMAVERHGQCGPVAIRAGFCRGLWSGPEEPHQSLVFKNHSFKNLVLLSPEIENLSQISPGRVQTSKKYIDYSPACVTDSESSTLSFCNGKAHIQFNFMHFGDGSV